MKYSPLYDFDGNLLEFNTAAYVHLPFEEFKEIFLEHCREYAKTEQGQKTIKHESQGNTNWRTRGDKTSAFWNSENPTEEHYNELDKRYA